MAGLCKFSITFAIAKVLSKFFPNKYKSKGIHPKASVDSLANIGNNVTIEAGAVIESGVTINDSTFIGANVFIGKNTKIGSNTQIGPNVTIYPNTEIGENCIIHAGVVIGSEGFGFIHKQDSIVKIPQIGKTIIKNNVEIGSNTTIDRGTFNNTIIHAGVKLDNLIQVGHNVTIGENTIIAAQTGIAGSTKIGKRVMMGGQVGVAGHIQVADEVKVQAQAGINSSIKEKGKAMFGTPAFAYRDFLRSYSIFKKLPALSDRLRKLEKENNK